MFRCILLVVFLCLFSNYCLAQSNGETHDCSTIDWYEEATTELTQDIAWDGVNAFITNAPQKDIQAVVVIKDGKLLFESYPNQNTVNTLHDIRSATKSIVSLLIGIAVDQGKLDVEDTMMSFLTDYSVGEVQNERKERITIEHLLTMASGLDANADKEDSPGHENYLYEAEDWLRFALNVPMAGEPGSVWSYASLNTYLLGVILEKATEQELEEFAQTYLFDPLGIKDTRWTFTPKGWVVAQGNFYVSARDLSRIGQLILNEGCWNGDQVVSKNWLHTSFEGKYKVSWPNYDTYGYQWYNHTLEAGQENYSYVFASGNGGQKLYVVPRSKLVVVIMTTAYNTNYGQMRSLKVFRRILESLE